MNTNAAPSLRATRAETRLTVYRGLRGSWPGVVVFLFLSKSASGLQRRKAIFSGGRTGEIRANKVDQENGRDMSGLDGFSKISRDPLGRSLRWRDLKLFQIKARWMVRTGGPGKFVLVSSFCSKVLVHDTKCSRKRKLRACLQIWETMRVAKHLERCFARKMEIAHGL